MSPLNVLLLCAGFYLVVLYALKDIERTLGKRLDAVIELLKELRAKADGHGKLLDNIDVSLDPVRRASRDTEDKDFPEDVTRYSYDTDGERSYNPISETRS